MATRTFQKCLLGIWCMSSCVSARSHMEGPGPRVSSWLPALDFISKPLVRNLENAYHDNPYPEEKNEIMYSEDLQIRTGLGKMFIY